MKFKAPKLLCLLALFISANFSFSQIEVKGKVVDFTSFLPIENASIYIQNTTIGTISNADGKFQINVPQDHLQDTLVVSSIGFKTFKVPLNEYDPSFEIFLEEDIASLDEVVVMAENRPTEANDIVLRALERLERNLPDSSYIQKGFLRHKERNKREFKWLIESAITVYDSAYNTNASDVLKINVDEVRKSFDLRDVDSVFNYVSYINQTANGKRLKPDEVRRSDIKKSDIIKAIRWNDERINGLNNLFKSQLNLLRNAHRTKALFGSQILDNHQFQLDTILVDNERKIYKIKIKEGEDFVGLNTEGVFNKGYHARGWLYIYYDNYAVKQVEYELIAASKTQKIRSKRLFDTQVNHKLVITYRDYKGKMYPSYIYYETPKLVNVGYKSQKRLNEKEKEAFNKTQRYYYTVQEILFTDIILDKSQIKNALNNTWDADMFAAKPYNAQFWDNYNILLESEEDEQLIRDLTRRAQLFKN